MLVPTVREKQFAMSVLVSLLAPGCQTQLTTVTRQQPASEQWPSSSLPPLKAFLWGKLGAGSFWADCIKMSSGPKRATSRWLLRSDSHVYSVWESVLDDSDEAGGPGWKHTERDLFGCPYVSGENADVSLPPKLYFTDKVICAHTHAYTTAHAHRGCGVHSGLSALSHTQISTKAVSLLHILSRQEFSYARWNASLADCILFFI